MYIYIYTHTMGMQHTSELDIEVLVHAVESATHGEAILQLHHDLLANQRLEEGKEVLCVRE
jgi:hypothetical protein